jgi:hypothetical protein
MSQTYLTTDELASRIKYDPRTVRERLKDSVLLDGIHYIRPFGGRKILFIWEAIERDMALSGAYLATPDADETESGAINGDTIVASKNKYKGKLSDFDIPMANGGVCRVAKPAKKGGTVRAAEGGVRHG